MVAKTARRRMPKRTSEQTRELMLRAAVDIIRDRANAAGDDVVAAALAHLRLTQVAERATALVRAETGDHHATAITTGAIYQIWPSQADFQAELLFHIAERQATLVPGLAASVLRFNQAAADQVPLADVLLDTMEEVHRHYCEDPLFRVELSFMISAVDPRVQKSLAHRQAAFKATADRAWQALMDAYELRPRPPFRLRDLTNAVAAVITGSVVIWFADAEGLADPAGEENRSLTGRTILAIFEHFTEPAT